MLPSLIAHADGSGILLNDGVDIKRAFSSLARSIGVQPFFDIFSGAVEHLLDIKALKHVVSVEYLCQIRDVLALP